MYREFITEIGVEDFKKRIIKSGKISCNFKQNRFQAYYSSPLPEGLRKCFDGVLLAGESGGTVVKGRFRYSKFALLFLAIYNVSLIGFTLLILNSYLSGGQKLPWELWFLMIFPLMELALFLIGTRFSKKSEKLLIDYFIKNLHCTELNNGEQTHG